MCKRLTHEEFLDKLKQKHPNIIVLEKYTTNKNKIKVKCLLDDFEWSPIASNLIKENPHGCPECARNKTKERMSLSNEQFVERFNNCGNEYVELLDEYKGTETKINFLCKICGKPFKNTPCSILSGTKHKECAIILLGKTRRKTNEKFLSEMKVKFPDLEFVTEYITSKDDITASCKIHNKLITKKADFFLRGSGCPICGRERTLASIKYTVESFKSKVLELHDNLEFLDLENEYKNVNSRITVRCKNDGYVWTPVAGSLFAPTKYCCPKCAGNAILTNEEFLKRLGNEHPDLELLSEYKRSNIPVDLHCKKCDTYFSLKPNKLQQGQDCPECNKSKGELRVSNYLRTLNIEFISQKEFEGLVGLGGGNLKYDFYLPKYNLLIEYNGIQHYEVVDFLGTGYEFAKERFDKQNIHYDMKLEFAQSCNIDLLEIPYWDYDNIEIILNNLDLQEVSYG